MKNFKIATLISLCLVFSLIGSSFAVAAEEHPQLTSNTFPTNDAVNNVIEKERPAVNAYSQIMEALNIADPADPMYPNYPSEYGGAYYDDGFLCICLTDDSNSVRQKYLSLVTDKKVVKFLKANYSYNDLYNLAAHEISVSDPAVTSVSVDMYTNRVCVGIDNTFDSTDGNSLYKIERNMLKQTSIVTDDDLPIYFVSETRAAPSSTELRGGQSVNRSSGTSTMAICGTWVGNNALLIAGHSTTIGDKYTINKTASSNGVSAEGVYKCYSNEHFYDYGIVKITSPASSYVMTNRVLNSANYTSITSLLKSSSGLVGTTICVYGYFSGFGVATIDKVDVRVHYADDMIIYGLTEATYTGSYRGKAGDSGAPVYSGHTMYGIYSGNDASATADATHLYYSPIYGVSNFSVKTN